MRKTKRTVVVGTLILLGILIITAYRLGDITVQGFYRPSLAQTIETGRPLSISNPGFEEGFYLQDNQGELKVGVGWRAGWDSNYGFRPEYKPPEFPNRIRSGSSAQQWFTTYAKHKGWIQTEITGVSPGEIVVAKGYVQVWSSDQNDPSTCVAGGKVWVHMGINPWGDGNALSPSTEWGTTYVDLCNQWVELEVISRAKSNRIVLFLWSMNEHAAHHNNVYWDDISAVAYSSIPIDPTSEPTSTPTVPAGTPIPCSCPGIEDIRSVMRQELDRSILRVGTD